ncbi:hypothetical protein M231_01432 [Tremella mesenterica]|uniref:MRH domain-containing protein n=1 Tax=Tremella mesenterica TaxID=5217 RepID=A0A4Q1BTL1_TREME|nr:uncharacterized protein TREMEDRAFT_65207 [Tremella mesenterica DSM 1558]EIW66804.1 hypothetical protein TREMEDRAFT_65207 [Tremella mesenterica DSM 1558]RXK41282.1 hypothetical protein M231_01432 [Tremella mesenterica]
MSNFPPCTLTLPDGTHYDLSSLSSASNDYEANVEGRSYRLNVCRGVVSELWKLENPDRVGGFIHRLDGDFSLGTTNTTLIPSPSTSEPLLLLQDGSPCPHNPSELASTAIRFICSPSDFNAGTPSLIASLPPNAEEGCHFFFEWRSHVACPTNPRAQMNRGQYIVFGSILLIAIMTWFLGHTLYNRLYLKRRGLDQFPIPSLPSLPHIRLPFQRKEADPGPSWGSWRRHGQYTSLHAEDHDETEGLAGRFSIDDEDERDGAQDAHPLVEEEADAWRSGPKTVKQGGAVGVHQGLVDV